MKLNWGTGIFIFLIVFVSLAIAFMVFAFNQEINLVYPDYYQKGVDYDQEISIEKRSNEYNNSINLISHEKNIELIFADSIKDKSTDIEVYFYSPSEKNNDYKIKKESIVDGFVIDKSNFNKDRYFVYVTWKMNNTNYKIKKEYLNK